MIDQHSLSLAVRWLHVAAMAFIGGGALLLWLALRDRTAPGWNRLEGGGLVRAAIAYERGFWIAAGLLVLTGVGNIAAFGTALQGPASGWGMTLIWKLAVVVALLGLSTVRSLVVARIEGAPAGARVLAPMFGATAVVVAAIVGLASYMAHG